MCLPQLIKYVFKRDSYLELKKLRLKRHIGHLSEQRFEVLMSTFENKLIPSILKQSGMKTIAWHKENGHDVWIVSASFDFILEKWCAKNEIGLIVNQTSRIKNNCLMTSEECNFEGKVERIREVINIKDYDEIYAYGDTLGDQAMLKLAHHSFYRHFN